MTIIVAHKRLMVADSMAVIGGRREPAGYDKISRCRDGSLVACCGAADDGEAFRQWAMAGFPADSKPRLTEGEDGFRALHMRLDGSVRTFYGTERSFITHQPAIIGESTACNFVAGAMAAGAGAETAVRLAVEHTIYVGGPVQVERLVP